MNRTWRAVLWLPGVFHISALLQMLGSQVLVTSRIRALPAAVAAAAAADSQLRSWHDILLAHKLQVVWRR